MEEREAETEEGLEVAWDVVKVVMGVGAEKDLGKEEREAGVTKEMEQRVVAAATAMVVMAQAGMVLVVAAAMARGHEVEAEAEVEAVGRMDLVAAVAKARGYMEKAAEAMWGRAQMAGEMVGRQMVDSRGAPKVALGWAVAAMENGMAEEWMAEDRMAKAGMSVGLKVDRMAEW